MASPVWRDQIVQLCDQGHRATVAWALSPGQMSKMVISNEKAVGEGEPRNSGIPRVFERHEIDDCCGGNAPVETDCGERGITQKGLAATGRPSKVHFR